MKLKKVALSSHVCELRSKFESICRIYYIVIFIIRLYINWYTDGCCTCGRQIQPISVPNPLTRTLSERSYNLLLYVLFHSNTILR